MLAEWEPDLDALDQDEPFELDDINLPHLSKRQPYSVEDVRDVFNDKPMFFEAKRPALWLMVGPVPGDFRVIPIAAARSPTQIRPIGVYRASLKVRKEYEANE